MPPFPVLSIGSELLPRSCSDEGRILNGGQKGVSYRVRSLPTKSNAATFLLFSSAFAFLRELGSGEGWYFPTRRVLGVSLFGARSDQTIFSGGFELVGVKNDATAFSKTLY